MQLTISKKIGLLTLLLVLLVAISMATQVIVARRISDSVADELQRVEEAKRTAMHLTVRAKQAQIAVIQVQQWLTDISATRARDGLDDGFDQAEQYAAEFQGIMDEFQVHYRATRDEKQLAKIQSMRASFTDYYRLGRRMANAYINESTEAGNREMGEFDPFAARLTEQMQEFVNYHSEQMHAAMDGIADSAEDIRLKTETMTIVAWVALLLAVITGGVELVMVVRLTRPILRISEASSRMAEGDLAGDVALNVRQRDEVGVLAGSFLEMRQSMKQMLTQLKGGVGSLASSSGTIGDTARRTAAGAEEQSAALVQMTTTIQEIRRTSEESARSAASVMGAAEQSSTTWEQGQAAVARSLEAVNALGQQASRTAERIQELGDRIEQVDHIINTVTSVTDQSNVLAVNASIEAAKAGELGAGFGVVATEVFNLARQSEEATERIRDILTDLRRTAERAVGFANEGAMLARESGQAIETFNEVMDSMAETLEGNARNAKQINQSVSEQAVGIAQVFESLEVVSQASTANANDAKQIDLAVAGLNNFATDIQDILSRFRSE